MINRPHAKRRRKFVYQRPTLERLQRLWRGHQFDDDFNKAVVDAYRLRNTKSLRILLFSDLPLSGEHRQMLAALIRWAIDRKHGKRIPFLNVGRQNELRIAQQVRQLRFHRYGNKSAPKGSLIPMIQEVIEQWDRAGFFDGSQGNISITNIRRELKRGTKRISKKQGPRAHR
jgi:hypothetical protein